MLNCLGKSQTQDFEKHSSLLSDQIPLKSSVSLGRSTLRFHYILKLRMIKVRKVLKSFQFLTFSLVILKCGTLTIDISL